MVKESDVVIIGGGMAGISCAYHLLAASPSNSDKQFSGKVILVEARDRLGGRMYGEMIGGSRLELGANWIHGRVGNPVYDLSQELGLSLQKELDDFGIGSGRTSDGQNVPRSLVDSVSTVYWSIIEECNKIFHDQRSSNPRGDQRSNEFGSLGEVVRKRINDHLATVDEPRKSIEKGLFDCFMNIENVLSSSNSLDELSLQYFGAYKEFDKENHVINGGYNQVYEGLLKRIGSTVPPERFEIILNSPVSRIDWSSINEQDRKVKVTIENDGSKTIIKCNRIVSTLPLGVLKANHEQIFHPSLPEAKRKAIQSLGFGVVDKIYLEYENNVDKLFDGHSMMTIWSENDKKAADWATKIYSLTKINQHTLLAWLTGNEAKRVEKLSPDEVGDHLTKYLRKFTQNSQFPKPKRVLVTKWASDPYSLGSYSFISIDSVHNDIDQLAAPIYSTNKKNETIDSRPSILFAGEATHSCFFSTVHGAFISGKKAALLLNNSDVSSIDSLCN
ncbi:spermine oxidase-like [Brevipalpus obovatus]|uniref:spermine oxidase-like n=1 Tax=Brevipalpus obovatus TaxID=246614 RepID=UPI003D9EB50A